MDPSRKPAWRRFQFHGKVAEELYEIFLELFDPDSPDDTPIEGQFQRIVSKTLDLKNDIDFGFTISRSEMTYTELLGSRAYQRALNKVKADIERERREKEKLDQLNKQ